MDQLLEHLDPEQREVATTLFGRCVCEQVRGQAKRALSPTALRMVSIRVRLNRGTYWL